jgi:hypothetical protein
MWQVLGWLLAGFLLGAGFVSAFAGGTVLLIVGVILAITLAVRFRGRYRGWSGLPYTTGASAALFLLPYVLGRVSCQPTPGSPDCYRAFTLWVFGLALLLAVTGLAAMLFEFWAWRQRVRPGGFEPPHPGP